VPRRLNDDGNSQFDASKLPFVDIDAVASFLQSGMRADALERLVLPTEHDSLAGLARQLQECCSDVFGAVPAAVSASRACVSRHAVLSQQGDADVSRMTAFGACEYACFLAHDEIDGPHRVLGIARCASSDASAQIEVALLQFAPGERVVDAQFYKDARLLVLLCDLSGTARLDLVDCEQLPFAGAGLADTVAIGAHRSEALAHKSVTDERTWLQPAEVATR